MTYLTRDQLIVPVPPPVEDVDLPELGGSIRIRGLTAAERDAWTSTNIRGNGSAAQVDRSNVMARLLVLSIVDEEGKPIFKPEDAVFLGAQPAKVLEPAFVVACRLSGLTGDMEAKKGN